MIVIDLKDIIMLGFLALGILLIVFGFLIDRVAVFIEKRQKRKIEMAYKSENSQETQEETK